MNEAKQDPRAMDRELRELLVRARAGDPEALAEFGLEHAKSDNDPRDIEIEVSDDVSDVSDDELLAWIDEVHRRARRQEKLQRKGSKGIAGRSW